ncbi:MAG: glycosyltransferase family 2 protein [Prevotella sp.]|jgi:dolichol-phosphate mannosyltransferase
MKIYFVMPAYNEEANIEDTIRQWYPVVEKAGVDCRLVIANDGSKDRTFEIMEGLKSRYPQFVPLDKPNAGHGPTVIYLYNYAIREGADWIFQTDSDGQTNPLEFQDFLDATRKYDCIMGNRTVRGDGNDRKMVENVLRTYVWLYFHVWVPDANAPFRLMKASVVEKYLRHMPADFNLPNAVLAACFSKFHERVTYRVISFKPRQGGVNSINPKKILKIGWKAISDFWVISRQINKLGKL